MLLHQNLHISAELSITSVSLLRTIRYENLGRHPNTASEDIDFCFRPFLPLLIAPTQYVEIFRRRQNHTFDYSIQSQLYT